MVWSRITNFSTHGRKVCRINNQLKRTLNTSYLLRNISSSFVSRTCTSPSTLSPFNHRSMFTGFVNFKDSVTITFTDRVQATRVVQANIGDTLLDVAKDNDIDGIEGACDGTLACSTCHCIFSDEDYEKLELDNITDDELDMLDLAYGLTDTSRLGCAVDVVKEMDGIQIKVPESTVDNR